ncbi:unnamed protein product [Fusarium venenatum]|uniref:Uncharacterized protein n=1 Tax=Fusarium venenatum TaxID=56646 RepID=A0A2L2U2Q8_9HYPO|nr:uncharacterized protein FVRRES_08852 [Fusarium venenatum]CEI68775.1 unnamed protein product [Fusarium venenatum]
MPCLALPSSPMTLSALVGPPYRQFTIHTTTAGNQPLVRCLEFTQRGSNMHKSVHVPTSQPTVLLWPCHSMTLKFNANAVRTLKGIYLLQCLPMVPSLVS